MVSTAQHELQLPSACTKAVCVTWELLHLHAHRMTQKKKTTTVTMPISLDRVFDPSP